jgi:hypothetical protein
MTMPPPSAALTSYGCRRPTGQGCACTTLRTWHGSRPTAPLASMRAISGMCLLRPQPQPRTAKPEPQFPPGPAARHSGSPPPSRDHRRKVPQFRADPSRTWNICRRHAGTCVAASGSGRCRPEPLKPGNSQGTPNRAVVSNGLRMALFSRRFSRIWTWSWQRATIGIAARYKELVEDAQLRKGIFCLCLD